MPLATSIWLIIGGFVAGGAIIAAFWARDRQKLLDRIDALDDYIDDELEAQPQPPQQPEPPRDGGGRGWGVDPDPQPQPMPTTTRVEVRDDWQPMPDPRQTQTEVRPRQIERYPDEQPWASDTQWDPRVPNGKGYPTSPWQRHEPMYPTNAPTSPAPYPARYTPAGLPRRVPGANLVDVPPVRVSPLAGQEAQRRQSTASPGRHREEAVGTEGGVLGTAAQRAQWESRRWTGHTRPAAKVAMSVFVPEPIPEVAEVLV
jgi:hypothetical protein